MAGIFSRFMWRYASQWAKEMFSSRTRWNEFLTEYENHMAKHYGMVVIFPRYW